VTSRQAIPPVDKGTPGLHQAYGCGGLCAPLITTFEPAVPTGAAPEKHDDKHRHHHEHHHHEHHHHKHATTTTSDPTTTTTSRTTTGSTTTTTATTIQPTTTTIGPPCRRDVGPPLTAVLGQAAAPTPPLDRFTQAPDSILAERAVVLPPRSLLEDGHTIVSTKLGK